VLPLDVLVQRAALAVLIGFGADVVLARHWAIFVGVLAFYVLLVVGRKPVSKWPPG
jgi:hypothetical protein